MTITEVESSNFKVKQCADCAMQPSFLLNLEKSSKSSNFSYQNCPKGEGRNKKMQKCLPKSSHLSLGTDRGPRTLNPPGRWEEHVRLQSRQLMHQWLRYYDPRVWMQREVSSHDETQKFIWCHNLTLRNTEFTYPSKNVPWVGQRVGAFPISEHLVNQICPLLKLWTCVMW